MILAACMAEIKNWNRCPASPSHRKARIEPTSRKGTDEWRNGAANRPGADANRSSKHSAVVNNPEAIEARDLTSQSSRFMVERGGT